MSSGLSSAADLSLLGTDELRQLLGGVTAGTVSSPVSSDRSDFSIGTRFGYVPLLRQEVLLDEEGTAYVLVFPCEQSVGGIVDTEEIIDEPMEACRRMFLRRRNPASHETLEEGFELLACGPLRAGVFHAVVRAAILRRLADCGLTLESFPSVDGDEVFLKIGVDRKGTVARALARRFQYSMPFRASAYKEVRCPGQDVARGAPMADHKGRPYVAYCPYSDELQDKLEDLRHIDVVRLVYMCLDEWMDLAEMKKQQVLVSFFPAMEFDRMAELYNCWGSLRHLLQPPRHSQEDHVRNYLGETATFFFRWLCFYCRALVPLSAVGLLCAVRRLPQLALELETQRYIQVAFAFCMVIWAAVFQVVFARKSQASVLRWGMKDVHMRVQPDRPEYKVQLEGTWRLRVRRVFSELFVAGFCLSFVVALLWTEDFVSQALHHREPWAVEYSQYFTVIIIKVVSFVWTYLAPMIANMQNHRTESAHNASLTRNLAMVKIFVALFPFVHQAFLKRLFEPICGEPGDTLATLAWQVYSKSGWPHGIDGASAVKFVNGTAVAVSPRSLGWLADFSYTHADGHLCLYGCYPVHCHEVGACVTNCYDRLENDLWSVFVVHIASTIVLSLLIPIFCTRLSVQRELRKVQRSAEDKPYTLLQFQAKCHEVASYSYMSWGGSQVEDFLEFAIGFALLTCFGIVLPSMAVLAFLGTFIEYRLLAFRMTAVTARPVCYGADGIGLWEDIFDIIAELAVMFNVGQAVFLMHPMRSWSRSRQLGAFLVLEHSMLAIRKVIKFFFFGEPAELQRIRDYNERFLAQATFQRAPALRPSGRRGRTKPPVELPLGPRSQHFEVLGDLGLGFL